jgi:hypothetical protein
LAMGQYRAVTTEAESRLVRLQRLCRRRRLPSSGRTCGLNRAAGWTHSAPIFLPSEERGRMVRPLALRSHERRRWALDERLLKLCCGALSISGSKKLFTHPAVTHSACRPSQVKVSEPGTEAKSAGTVVTRRDWADVVRRSGVAFCDSYWLTPALRWQSGTACRGPFAGPLAVRPSR